MTNGFRVVQRPGSPQQGPILRVALQIGQRQPVVEQEPARTYSAQKSKYLAMVLSDRGRHGAPKEQILVRVQEQRGLKRAAEPVNSGRQLGERQPLETDARLISEFRIEKAANRQALVAQVDAQRPLTRLLRRGVKHKKALRAAQVQKTRERPGVIAKK